MHSVHARFVGRWFQHSGVGGEQVHPGTMCVLGRGHTSDQASVLAQRGPVRGAQARGSLPSDCASVRPTSVAEEVSSRDVWVCSLRHLLGDG